MGHMTVRQTGEKKEERTNNRHADGKLTRIRRKKTVQTADRIAD